MKEQEGRFNVHREDADDAAMSDVDAMRTPAGGRGLGFVDLDAQAVDSGMAEVLPEELARRLHVVAIRQKFGTPVIAVANPDDTFALDTIRDSIGKEFSLVVAPREQIVRYIDRLYGPSQSSGPAAPTDAVPVAPATAPPPVPLPAIPNPSVVSARQIVTPAVEDTSGPSLYGSAFLPEGGSSTEEPPGYGGRPQPIPPGSIEIGTDLTPSPDALATSASELARTAWAAELTERFDSAAETADLVDEAVATFEGQQAEPGLLTGLASTLPPMAKALIEGNRVSLADMELVLEEHDRTGRSIARILTAKKLVTEADLMWGMAHEMGLEFVDLDMAGIKFSESEIIPEATARYHNVLVISDDTDGLVVAASNPTDVFAMDDLRTIIGRSFRIVVATRGQIHTYIDRAYGGGDAAGIAETASLEFDREERGAVMDDIQVVTEEAPIVRYVNLLMVQAINERASDIHVEPTANNLRIRYRIDGVLHDMSTAPRSIAAAVTTRLKVMADMNIAEHRIPQDGRISVTIGHKEIDLRMATLPTINGEKIVMRVLDKSSVVLGFPDLGFDDDLLATYAGIYTKPYGTILVTGPTGSGKSTTLYATLIALNSPEKNIITVEDPVELKLPGVNQMQLNVKAGLTFASALRSILRSDPDIVLVGEIRDKETAVIAVEASLTGHLVLATLHTNSAAATPMRLVEMGLQPFLVTSSLTGVLAQRLARRLCVHCKEGYDVTDAEIVLAGWKVEEMTALEEISGRPHFYRAKGCSACANTGFRGRKALAELMPMSEEINRLIIEGGTVDDIHRMAVSQGMVTLRQSGLRKAIEGETTLEEVLRVVA